MKDPPRGSEHWIPTDPRFQHGVDLVRYIKSNPEFADFCVGVAGHTIISVVLILMLITLLVQRTRMGILIGTQTKTVSSTT